MSLALRSSPASALAPTGAPARQAFHSSPSVTRSRYSVLVATNYRLPTPDSRLPTQSHLLWWLPRNTHHVVHHLTLPRHHLAGGAFELTKALGNADEIRAPLHIQVARQLRQPQRQLLTLPQLAGGKQRLHLLERAVSIRDVCARRRGLNRLRTRSVHLASQLRFQCRERRLPRFVARSGCRGSSGHRSRRHPPRRHDKAIGTGTDLNVRDADAERKHQRSGSDLRPDRHLRPPIRARLDLGLARDRDPELGLWRRPRRQPDANRRKRADLIGAGAAQSQVFFDRLPKRRLDLVV